MKKTVCIVTAVVFLTIGLSSVVNSTNGARFVGPEGKLIESFAYEDGSSLMILASPRGMDYHIYIIFIYPDGATMTNWFVMPYNTDLKSIEVKHCRGNVQVFGQASRAWRYVWTLPSESYLPIICQ